MRLATARFLSLFLTALALGPAMAHLLELPGKIYLTRADYLTVQQIYRGWSLLGVIIFGALVSTLVVAAMVFQDRRAFTWTLVALLCLIASQAVFWTFTFPANQATNNWTQLPDNWEPLRSKWEYSHAAGALLTLAAFSALLVSVLKPAEPKF